MNVFNFHPLKYIYVIRKVFLYRDKSIQNLAFNSNLNNIKLSNIYHGEMDTTLILLQNFSHYLILFEINRRFTPSVSVALSTGNVTCKNKNVNRNIDKFLYK